MPGEEKTNRELAEEAKSLGELLGEEVSTAGLNKGQLVELVNGLRAKLDEATSEPPAPAAADGVEPPPSSVPAESSPKPSPPAGAKRVESSPNPPPLAGKREEGAKKAAPPPREPSAAPPPPSEPRPPYVVAPGRSVTSRRGIIDAGHEVRPTDFAGGPERLEALVKAGVVVKT